MFDLNTLGRLIGPFKPWGLRRIEGFGARKPISRSTLNQEFISTMFSSFFPLMQVFDLHAVILAYSTSHSPNPDEQINDVLPDFWPEGRFDRHALDLTPSIFEPTAGEEKALQPRHARQHVLEVTQRIMDDYRRNYTKKIGGESIPLKNFLIFTNPTLSYPILNKIEVHPFKIDGKAI